MAKAIKGDYVILAGLRQLSIDEMKEYNFIDYLGNYKIYKKIKSKDAHCQHDYIIGYHETNVFKKVAKIYFDKVKEYYEVNTIYISENYRRDGLATKLYTYFATKQNFIILGSDMQRFGARRLWSKLSRTPGLTVDIIDFSDGSIIEEGVEIYHGCSDEEFDKRIWSYNNDKKHIRLVLKSEVNYNLS